MDLTKIVSISGRPGLFKLLTEMKNGFIVESLQEGKRFPVFGNARVSSLEEISIYSTGDEDIGIREVLKAIDEKVEKGEKPDPKAGPEELQSFFAGAVPEYDAERVYLSDIKKILSWYRLLKENDLLSFEEEEEEKEVKGEKGEKEEEKPGEEKKDEKKDPGE